MFEPRNNPSVKRVKMEICKIRTKGSFVIKNKGLRVNMKNLNANRENYGLYSKLGELKSKNGFCRPNKTL